MKKEKRGKIKSIPFAIKTKAVDASGNVTIEGWANKAVVDRGLDFIVADAWDLTNYQKNPIILFNHDKDKPIGRAIEVKPTDEGLYIKAQISNSKDPFVSYIRDMIAEGILNAFSVGFDSKDEAKDATGVNQITSAELYETSVVSLPMNQDSLFSLTSKDLNGKTYHEAKMKVLKEKGAALASTLQDRIFDMESSVDGFNRDEALQKIADLAGVKIDEVKLVLVGDASDIDEKLLAAFAAYLGVPLADLQTLDGVDKDPTADGADEAEDEVVNQEEAAEEDSENKKPAPAQMALPPKPPVKPLKPKKPAPGAKKPDVTKPNVAPADGKIPGEVPPEAPVAKKAAGPEIQAVKVPKSDNMTPEDAKAEAEKAGYKTDKMEDDEGFYVFHQEPKDKYVNTVDMDVDGMTVSVGMGNKEVPVEAEDPKSEEKSEEDVKPDPVEKTVDASTVQPEVGDGNPAIDQAKQTNVLLGALIDAQANTNDLLSNLVQELQKTVMMSMGEKIPPAVDETEQKLLKVAQSQLLELNKRIKNL